MDVKYSPEVRQQPEGLALLEQASMFLAEILEPKSSQVVRAEWSRVENRQGQPLTRLTLRDDTGEVSTDFTSDELENPLHMRFRLPRLWGDLLEIRNNQEHLQVKIISDQLATSYEGR